MNPRILSLLILLASLSQSACQKFSKNFDSVAKTCGIAPEQLERVGGKDPLTFQLSVADDDQRFLQAHLLQNGDWQKLEVSSGSCVVLPADQTGRILLENPVRNTALWLDPETQVNRFNRVDLKRRKPYSMRLGCNPNGTAVRDAIDLDAFYAGDGEAQAGLWVNLTAESRDGRRLVLHDAALQDRPFPSRLNLQELGEGDWLLKGRAGYRKGGESVETLETLGETQGCLLQIMRKAPARPDILAGTSLSGKPPRLTLKVDDPLLIPRPAQLGLEACVEPIDEALSSCGACSGDYTSVDHLTLTKAGLFAAYFRFRDAAGNRSAPSCATIQSSSSAPRIGLQWEQKAWNTPYPLLEKPPVTLTARVETLQHEILPPEQLEATLECKLTITSVTGQSRPAFYSRCLNGRCAGKTFRDWMPCSRDISIDLTQEWLRPENWESSINLFVRANDGVGHESQERKNLWFSGRNLAHALATESGKTSGLYGSKVIQRKDRSVLIVSDGRLLYAGSTITADKDVDTMLAGRTPTSVRILEDNEGLRLWGLWTFPQGAVLGRRTGTQWQFSLTAEQGGPSQSCEDLINSPSGLICVGKQSLAILQKDQTWVTTNLGTSCTGAYSEQRYAETASGRYWVCSNQKLLFQAAGQTAWTAPNVPANALQSLDTVFAHQGELWLRGSFLYHQVDGNWTAVPPPQSDFSEITGTSNGDALIRLATLPDGRLRLGFSAFDRPTQTWKSLAPRGLKSAGGLAQDLDGGLWTVIDERALYRLYPEPILLPLEMIGVNPGATADSIALNGSTLWAGFSVTGHVQFKGDWGLYKIEPRGWQTMAFGFQQSPAFGEQWREVAIEDQGSYLIRKENGDLLRLDRREGWTLASAATDRPSGLRDIARFLRDRLGLLLRNAANELWRFAGDRYTKLFDDKARLLDNAHMDADGHVWSVQARFGFPFTLYLLQEDQWQIVPVKNLPADCMSLYTIVDSRRFLVQCPKAPVLITDGTAESLATLFPEVNFAAIDGYDIIPVEDPATPWILITVYDRSGQRVIRHDLRDGAHTTWSVPKDKRLGVGGDISGDPAAFKSLHLHPEHPDQFLLRTPRCVLRPDGSRLVVAADAQHMMQAQGVPIKIGRVNEFTFATIDSFGEVWLLIPELGLVRFDRIWQSVDAPDTVSSAQPL